MKSQDHLSNRIEVLLSTKSWAQLNAQEQAWVLEEIDQDAYEQFRCLIQASREMHLDSPAPPKAIKANILRQMQQNEVRTPKKAVWQDWFQWQFPAWQVSLAGIAFVLLYWSGWGGHAIDAASPSGGNEFFQDPIDTVFLDQEQAPEDSSDQQQQPYLESGWHPPALPLPAHDRQPEPASKPDRSLLALSWPAPAATPLPPTQAPLHAHNIIPPEWLEIKA